MWIHKYQVNELFKAKILWFKGQSQQKSAKPKLQTVKFESTIENVCQSAWLSEWKYQREVRKTSRVERLGVKAD